MVVILSLMENLLVEQLGNYFNGFIGKIKLRFVIKRLKNEVGVLILKQYGDREYYLDFDRFLIEQNVLEKIIKNFLNQDVLQSKTINQSVDFYMNLFIEKYPKYKLYNIELKKIIKNILKSYLNNLIK